MQDRPSGAHGSDVLRIAAIDRRADDHDVGSANVTCLMTDRDAHALAAQSFDQRRLGNVRPCNPLVARSQDASDRAHTDAADAYEMVRHPSHFLKPTYRSAQESAPTDRFERADERWTLALRGAAVPSPLQARRVEL